METPVSLDRLEKPDSVGGEEVVPWLDSIDDWNGVLDTTVWLASVDDSPGLDVDCPAWVDRLNGVDTPVAPENDKLVCVGLSAVNELPELETDCSDELGPGTLVD